MPRKAQTSQETKADPKIDEVAVKRAQQVFTFYDSIRKAGGGIPLMTVGLLYDIRQYMRAKDIDMQELETEAERRFAEFLVGS